MSRKGTQGRPIKYPARIGADAREPIIKIGVSDADRMNTRVHVIIEDRTLQEKGKKGRGRAKKGKLRQLV